MKAGLRAQITCSEQSFALRDSAGIVYSITADAPSLPAFVWCWITMSEAARGPRDRGVAVRLVQRKNAAIRPITCATTAGSSPNPRTASSPGSWRNQVICRLAYWRVSRLA